jgi:hypothetical protein
VRGRFAQQLSILQLAAFGLLPKSDRTIGSNASLPPGLPGGKQTLLSALTV